MADQLNNHNIGKGRDALIGLFLSQLVLWLTLVGSSKDHCKTHASGVSQPRGKGTEVFIPLFPLITDHAIPLKTVSRVLLALCMWVE